MRRNTTLRDVPLVPELRLHLADDPYDMWYLVKEARGGELGLPLPYWAFAWAGGQALARYLLDHPEAVRGRSVLDVASGSALDAIAAARAGATHVIANDIDPLAGAAMHSNAKANRVAIEVNLDDLLDTTPDAEVVLVGDAWFERALAERVTTFLARARAAGADVFVGDPDRPYFARDAFAPLAVYDVPVLPVLEDVDVKRATVYRMR